MNDYIIVGAGPSGITLAYLLSKQGKKCILVDKQASIGGCHRVLRVDGMFTEHSPRVYLTSYLNTRTLLEQMDLCMDDFFVNYQFSIASLANRMIDTLYTYELAAISWAFLQFTFDSSYGKQISVKSFAEDYGFSPESKDFLDRFCRLSDGADYERFSMYQFLQTTNQSLFYSIQQPNSPNDVGLFPAIKRVLDEENIQLRLNTTVTQLIMNSNQTKVTGVTVQQGSISSTLYANHVILAVTPQDLYKILTPSPCPNAFGSLANWVSTSSYNTYIGATFHWNTVVPIDAVWGFPYSDWGLISIVLTDYMNMNDARSKTVVSVCISYIDRVSSHTGKTANQTITNDSLLQEMFRQLQETYPLLPTPTTMILSPTVYRDQGIWKEQDSGFFHSVQTHTLCAKGTIPNLYQVGPQNGHSPLHATTFESAVSNAMAFVQEQCLDADIYLQSPFELRIIVLLVFILLLLLVVWKLSSSNEKENATEVLLDPTDNTYV
jgi:hypothetical protein